MLPKPGTSESEADLASRVAPSIVEVVTEDGNGSGVAVSAGILTSAHLVDQAHRIRIVDRAGQAAPATILRLDRNADLALLQNNLSLAPLDTELMGQQRQGDEVLVFCYPLGPRTALGGDALFTRGLISATSVEPGSGHALIQTNAALPQGTAGGALVNLRGKLIGVLTFSPSDGVNVAVAIDTVTAFVAAPQHMVAPAPPPPIFSGDPRVIAPSAGDLGDGRPWALVATDTTHLADGLFGAQFVVEPTSDPAITVVVGVLPGTRSAIDQWPALSSPSDASFVDYPVNPVGDAAYGAVSGEKQTLTISARAKNVLLSVEVTSTSYLAEAAAIEKLVAQMIDRVNAQAR